MLYQPGLGDIRETGTGLVSDLASQGYIVVTMDDTYEAQVVELPDGRLATTRPDQSHVGPARLADTRFVLDQLVRLQSGENPDAMHRKLPTGLSEAIDTSKVGMFGHSLGGAMAAEAMAADSRIHAGIDLDGTILLKKRTLNPKLDNNLAGHLGDRPFMLFTRQGHDTQDDPTLAGLWSGLRGSRLLIALKDAQHFSFTDFEEFLPQLLSAGVRPDKITRAVVTRSLTPTQALGCVVRSRHGRSPELLRRALADAQTRGCSTSSLQSSPIGFSVYERLGYRDRGAIEVWECRTP